MRVILFSVLFLYSIASIGQGHTIRQFSVDDGLPSSHVYEVKQDTKGFYWISTSEGVVKYDGYSFVPQKGPFAADVWWTYQDSEDRIWGLTQGTKLWHLDNDTFNSVSPNFQSLKEGAVFSRIHQDNYGLYWVSSGPWIGQFGKGETKSFVAPEKLNVNQPASYPTFIQDDQRNSYYITLSPLTVWKIVENGEFEKHYEYSTNIFFRNHVSEGQSATNDANTSVLISSIDSIYTIRNDSLFAHINGKQTSLGLFPAQKQLKFESYKAYRLKDKYIFLHANGNFITDLNFTYLREYDFIEQLSINTVYEDHENSLWLATADQGLLYLTQEALASTRLQLAENKSSDICAIGFSEDAGIWAGFKNCEICKIENESLNCFETSVQTDGNLEVLLREFKVVSNYLILMIGYYEIQVFDINQLNNGIVKPVVFNQFNNTKSLNVGLDGNVYITDYDQCFQLLLKDQDIPVLKTLYPDKALALSAIQDNAFVISTMNGLYAISPKGDSVLLDNNISVKKFGFDTENALWAINKGRGISRIGKTSTKSVRALEDVLVRDIYFENDKTLWVATTEGLLQLKHESIKEEFSVLKKFTLANGLLTNDVTSIYADDKHLYIGTSKGLNIVNRASLSNSSTGHSVFLTNAVSRGEKLPVSERYILSADDNSLELEYAYISPKSAGQITYQYKLEGVDVDWQETEDTRVHYPFLPAGNYTFRLSAKDINGVSSEENIILEIKVKQHWWKTTWFLVVAFLSSSAAIISFFLIRIKQLRKQDRERAEMNNRIAELKLNALQSQMNPHFVFNVLNSIQDCFVSNNVLEANRYMTDFSKLMRLFLESSDDRFITLSKEIKLLSYYIALERMRLDNKFEFEFNVAKEIDPDEYRIPTMILQPIVENAILHGLRYKEGVGRLRISFKLAGSGVLVISVEDNGVGRKRSEAINKERRKDHVSKAADIIKERIEIINNGENDRIDMQFIDLFDDDKPLGTRVELVMNLAINN